MTPEAWKEVDTNWQKVEAQVNKELSVYVPIDVLELLRNDWY